MTGSSGWRLTRAGGLFVARSGALDRIPGLSHAVSTRDADGSGEFDLGTPDDARPAIRARRAALAAAVGCAGTMPAILRQVHGARIVDARKTDGDPVEADGVAGRAAEGSGFPIPAVRAADCVPLLIASRDGSAFAAVHAGWRGVASGIAAAAVARLEALGSRPDDLVAGLGPAIGPCCYEVGEEVVTAITAAGVPRERFAQLVADGRVRVDLHGAIAAQLHAAGVPAGAVDKAPWCTRCREDLFFSYRREGASSGRHMALIGRCAPQS